MKAILVLIRCLALIALVIFSYGVVMACVYSSDNAPEAMSPVLGYIVTGVAAILATNFGAVVGVTGLSNFLKRELVSDFRFSGIQKVTVPILGCWFYIIVLLGVTAYWVFFESLTEDVTQVVNILPNFAKTLIGIAVGGLALALEVKQAKKKRAKAEPELV